MNKYKRLGKNSLLVFVGSIGSKLLAILMLPFYTAWLSVESYGDVDLVSTYVSLIMGIVTLCVTDAIFRFPQGKGREEQRILFSSGLAVVSLSLGLFGGLSSGVLNWATGVRWGVFDAYAGYIYTLLIFSFLQLYLQQFSRSIDRMSVFVMSGVILTFVIALSSLLLVPKWGVDGYLISQLIGFAASISYTSFSMRIDRYLSYSSISVSAMKEMLSYSIPMIPNATLWWILGTSNRLFLEHYHSTDLVGIFAVSNRFPSIITMVFNTFFLSWQISVLEEFEKPGFRIFYNRIMRLCFVLLLLVEFLLSLSSYWLIRFFADEAYLDAWRYIPFLGLAAVFSSFSTLMGTMFMATKNTRYFLTTSLWGGLLCLGMNLLLIPLYGIMGATVSLLIAHFIILYLRIIKSDKYVSLEGKGDYLSQIALLLGAIIGILFLDAWSLRLMSFSLFFALFILLNKGFVKEVLDSLVNIIRK